MRRLADRFGLAPFGSRVARLVRDPDGIVRLYHTPYSINDQLLSNSAFAFSYEKFVFYICFILLQLMSYPISDMT